MSEKTSSIGGVVKGLLAKLLLAFLVVTFAIWGIGDIVRDSATKNIADVGDSTISVADFQREWRFMQSQMQHQVPAEMLNSPVFQQQVLQRLVHAELLLETAGDAGMYVSEEIIADHILKSPQFQDIRGDFDAEAFKRTLQASRMTAAQFSDVMSKELLVSIMAETVNMGNATAPDSWKALTRMSAQEMRSVDMVTLKIDTTYDIPNPPEHALKEYYERNLESYMLPESRDFVLATIKPSDIEAQAKASITEQEVTDYLASQERSDSAAERKQARKEILPNRAEETAYELSITLEDALAAGDPLKDALAASNIPYEIKHIEGVSQQSLASSHKDHAQYLTDGFDMQEGDSTNLLITPKGEYYILQMTALTPAQPQAFEAVSDHVAKEMIAESRVNRVRQRGEELRVKLAGAAGVDARNAVLKDYKLKRNVRVIRRGDIDTKDITPTMRAAIFAAPIDSVLGPFEAADGSTQNIAILTTVRVPNPDEVKPNITADSATDQTFQELANASLQRAMQAEHPVRMRANLMEGNAQ